MQPENFTSTVLTRRALFVLIEDEIRRFRAQAAVPIVRKLLIDPVDKLRYPPDSSGAVRVTMVIKFEGDVTIGYRHTADRARWGVFRPDATPPYTLVPESCWHVHLADAFYSSPAWNGEALEAPPNA